MLAVIELQFLKSFTDSFDIFFPSLGATLKSTDSLLYGTEVVRGGTWFRLLSRFSNAETMESRHTEKLSQQACASSTDWRYPIFENLPMVTKIFSRAVSIKPANTKFSGWLSQETEIEMLYVENGCFALHGLILPYPLPPNMDAIFQQQWKASGIASCSSLLSLPPSGWLAKIREMLVTLHFASRWKTEFFTQIKYKCLRAMPIPISSKPQGEFSTNGVEKYNKTKNGISCFSKQGLEWPPIASMRITVKVFFRAVYV